MRQVTRKSLFVAGLALAGVLAVGIALVWKGGIGAFNPSSTESLARRAQTFWDLKVAGDTMGAYEYMAETYRRRVTPGQFAREGGRVMRTGAAVKQVNLDDRGALVKVQLKFRFNQAQFVDTEETSEITDRWIYENGAWYRWPPGL